MIFKRKKLLSFAARIALAAKKILGQHIGGRGYSCVTVAAITKEQVKNYMENQDDEAKVFQVWDEQLESDSSEDKMT